MELGIAAQWAAFAVMAFIAVAGALGMTTTMSMYRSAIFLMASFIGVGGLFILLMADLLGLLQVMMYIGGMLVMALFMVLFSGDPGGAMMTSMMALPLPEKFFSLGLDRNDGGHGHDHHGHGGGDNEDSSDEGDGGGHEGHDAHGEHGDHDGEEEDEEESGGSMDMEPMFILSNKKPAAILATVIGLVLSALVLFRPAWPMRQAVPAQNSAEQIGDLLMGKYMIAFEGAGLMILLGIFGAVYLARAARFPDPIARDAIQAAVDEVPPPAATDALDPFFETDAPGRTGDGAASAAHAAPASSSADDDREAHA